MEGKGGKKKAQDQVLVRYNGKSVYFRVTPNLTFGQLKEDCCVMFNLSMESFNLQDPEGGQLWPSEASVTDALNVFNNVEVEIAVREDDTRAESRFPNLSASITNLNASRSNSSQDIRKPPISLAFFLEGAHKSTEVLKNGVIKATLNAPKSTKFSWPETPPQFVLLVMKLGSATVFKYAETVGKWLETKNLTVCVESSVSKEFPCFSCIEEVKKRRLVQDPAAFIDFIVTLGGDGTVLHLSSLFEYSVPPVLSFNLGSLGFLTRHQLPNFRADLSALLAGEMYLLLRARLCCRILTPDDSSGDGWKVLSEQRVLNEIVIDKGGSSTLTNLDTYCDGVYVTTVQADGVIVCTPTGSTAYSLSCGGTMIHPSVPSIALTPISPHSLSFRPVIFPSTAELRITNSKLARNTAFISFDGKNKTELQENDVVSITTSEWPLPSASSTNDISSWFSSLAECLHWNDRKIQNMPVPESSL